MSLGRWFGVQVRLHISFILVVLFVMFIFMREPLTQFTTHGWVLIGVWFASVLLHEAGHLIAGVRLGIPAELVVLTPFGGVSDPTWQVEPQREITYSLAGPLANLAACLVSWCLLFSLGDVALVKLLNPFHPEGLLQLDNLGVTALQLTFWVNWCLVLVNLLPAYPLDNGRVLRAVLWHSLGAGRTRHVIMRCTQLTAIALLLVGWGVGMPSPAHPVPAVFPLAVLATYLLFQARRPEDRRAEEHSEELFGYDFSQGYTSLEEKIDPPAPQRGPMGRWFEKRREQREQQRRELELAEEQRADAILAAMHEHGAESLTPEDRALLVRVSARYRARLGSRD